MPTFPDGVTSLGLRSTGVISHYPAASVNYDGTLYVEIGTKGGLGTGSYAEFLQNIQLSVASRLALGSYGLVIGDLPGFLGVSRSGLRSLGGGALGFRPEPLKGNFVKWSNIGAADFTIWKDNIAGERPLDWKGVIYEVRKLGNKAIAYGENGVSVLSPVGNTYGLQTIHWLGVKGKGAVAGGGAKQFFIDTSGKLFALEENKQKSVMFESSLTPIPLGYEEYLSVLNNPIMSLDSHEDLLYICDGAIGFIYNIKDGSLGQGPTTITGLGRQGGYLYAVASGPTTVQPLQICTGVYDFGTGKVKTIHWLDVGTTAEGALKVAVDYRMSRKDDFSTTKWKPVRPDGRAFVTALGRELRVRLKFDVYEEAQVNYIKVRGIIHDS